MLRILAKNFFLSLLFNEFFVIIKIFLMCKYKLLESFKKVLKNCLIFKDQKIKEKSIIGEIQNLPIKKKRLTKI